MQKRESRDADLQVTGGSENIFEDLGFADAPELQAKAELTRQICNILRRRKLTQREAAKVLGIAQPDVSALMNGRHTGFSLSRLMLLLTLLNREVEIVVKRCRKKGAGRKINVTAA